MKFRPCIDLHAGRVKQIVGSTLEGPALKENFVSEHGAAFYASMFRRDGLYGGHVIMLGLGNEDEALRALRAFPGGMQIGGGINEKNARYYLDNGASHVIVTSAAFSGDNLDLEALKRLSEAARGCLVLDLSCVETESGYFAAKNRWSALTRAALTAELLRSLEEYCAEYLIHAVSSEGKRQGADARLVELLAGYAAVGKNPVTYAGGLSSLDDIESFNELSGGLLDYTVGSALDIYGGSMPYAALLPRG